MTIAILEPTGVELPPRPDRADDWLARHWFAFVSTPNGERRAMAAIKRFDDADAFAVFVPTVRLWAKPRRRAGPLAKRWRHVERPLWAGYVFVGFAPGSEEIGFVCQCDGINGMVPNAGMLSAAMLCQVDERVRAGEFDSDQRPRRRKNTHKRGDRVTVDVHGMADIPAVVVSAKESAQTVLVELLASGVKVSVPLDKIAV